MRFFVMWADVGGTQFQEFEDYFKALELYNGKLENKFVYMGTVIQGNENK